MPRRWIALLPRLLALTVCVLAGTARADNWPQWRGPKGIGVSDEKNLPVTWGPESGLAWSTPLPEWGTSTPAIWGDAIFVTTQEDDALLLLRFDKATGKQVWSRRVGLGEPARMKLRLKTDDERLRQRFHQTHNLASPSPVTDGERVIVHFGNGDFAAYDFDGRRQWYRNLQEDHGRYTIWWGHANSPVLFGDLVISACMQDSLSDLGGPLSLSYVVAHDKRTGEQKWKTLRMTGAEKEANDAYTTPLLHETADGVEMILMGGTQIDAYDPITGKQRWVVPGLGGNRVITGPTIAHGMVYATVGMRGPLLAVKLSGQGRRDKDDAIAWQLDRGTPDSPSPVVWGDLLFLVNNNGIARCLDAHTGKEHWTQRLTGGYRASPIAADGRIYFLSTTGTCTVVAATKEFTKLAENELDDETIASPVVSDGRIYLRGRKALYCFGRS